MIRKFLSDNEILELVNNLSDLEVESEEVLVCTGQKSKKFDFVFMYEN